MGTTQFRGYPRVDPGAQPDGRTALNELADAVDADVANLSTGYRLAAVVHFTSSGTFSKGAYAGIRAVEVECIGAGGGSGYAAATNGAQISWGAGGAGGAYTHSWFDAASLSSAETVTVGTGGTGGTSGTPDGGDGGNSSFGSHVTAGGGQGGNDQLQSTANSGSSFIRNSGGAPSGTYDIGVRGEGDGSLDFVTGHFNELTALMGGAAGGPYSSQVHNVIGVNPAGVSSQAAVVGNGIGGGARGPANGTSSSSQNGAAGANGRVIVRVYV